MLETNSVRHVRLPNSLSEDGFTMKEQRIYLFLRSYMNSNTRIAHPSLRRVSEESGCSVNKIRETIKKLTEFGYLSIIKKGKCQYYKFSDDNKYEAVPIYLLHNNNITPEEQAFVAVGLKYMFTDGNGFGKISLSASKLADNMNSSESTIRRNIGSLSAKGFLSILKNKIRDPESCCYTETKLFDLVQLLQIQVLVNHEKRINNTEEEITEMKADLREINYNLEKRVEQLEKLIGSCIRSGLIEKQKKYTDSHTFTMYS